LNSKTSDKQLTEEITENLHQWYAANLYSL